MSRSDTSTAALLPHLLNLSFPQMRRIEAESTPLAAELLRLMKQNKIPLLSVTDHVPERLPGLADDPVWKEAVTQARGAYDHYRAEFQQISDTLSAKNIPHILMKSAGPFPYESDNFDILVPHFRREEILSLLAKDGFIPQIHYREDWKYLCKRFDQGRLMSIAHMHEEISWGVEVFLDVESVWSRAEISPDDPGFRVPSPEDSFLTTMAHGIYENDKVKLGDLQKLHRLNQRVKGHFDWEYMSDIASRQGWLAGFRFILSLVHDLEVHFWGSSLVPEPILKSHHCSRRMRTHASRLSHSKAFPAPTGMLFSKGLFLHKLLTGNPPAAILSHMCGFLQDNFEALLGISTGKGFLLTVSGMDGSGKSTLLDRLESMAKDLEYTPNRVWLRAGNSDTMQLINRLVRKLFSRRMHKWESEQSPTEKDPHRERVIGNPFLAWMWYSFALFELALQVAIKVRLPRRLGRFVLCDRYLVDSLVDLCIRCGRDPDRLNPNSLPLRILFPKADLSLLLHVSAGESIRRKREEFSEAQLERREDAYRSLGASRCLISVDTEKGFDHVLEHSSKRLGMSLLKGGRGLNSRERRKTRGE